MAKLWEVLKAIDEGRAVKATRYTTGRLVELNKNLGNNGVSVHLDGSTALFSVGDFEATDWHIVENLEQKKFDYLFVVYQVQSPNQATGQYHDSFEKTSLLYAKKQLKSKFLKYVIGIHSATGVTHEGETIILVQEGEMVE